MTSSATTNSPCCGGRFQTRFFETFSLLAPEAEKFLISSMRAALPQIKSDLLRSQCEEFIREEGGHSRMHRAFNQHLDDRGLNTQSLLNPLRKALGLAGSLPLLLRLVFTAALEHLSAITARRFINSHAAEQISDPRVRSMFVRHAEEEIAHRAVAFDVLNALYPRAYLLRTVAMIFLTLTAPLYLSWVLGSMLLVDGVAGPGQWLEASRWLLGGRADAFSLWRLAPDWLVYFRPGFHPLQDLD